MSDYDVYSVRGYYTSLGDGWTYLNAQAAPQIPERVSAAVARSFRLSTTPLTPSGGRGHHAQRPRAGALEGEGFVQQARVAVADLVGGTADCVVLGPSLEVLYDNLARSLEPMLRRNSSVVLSGLDSERTSVPFARLGAEVRWAQPDLGTGELPGWQYRELVDGSTRLVALSAAHGILGTLADVKNISDNTRSRSRAWVLADASEYAPHRLVDIEEMDVDILGVDLARLGGPQVAALVFRHPLMFKRLRNPELIASPVSPGLAGAVSATVDHYAALVEKRGSRRVRLTASFAALEAYLKELGDDLHTFLGSLPAVHILGVTGEAAAGANSDRLPRLSFAVNGVPADTVQQRLFDNGIVTSLAPSSQLLTDMGVDDIGGAVTVGLGPFNTSHDVEHLVRVVASLA